MYNLRWRNHLEISWSNNKGTARPPQNFVQLEKKPTLEEMSVQYHAKDGFEIQNDMASICNLEV